MCECLYMECNRQMERYIQKILRGYIYENVYDDDDVVVVWYKNEKKKKLHPDIIYFQKNRYTYVYTNMCSIGHLHNVHKKIKFMTFREKYVDWTEHHEL